MAYDWKTCQQCDGVRLPGRDVCVVHVNDQDAILGDVAQQPDFRGLRLDGPLLASILDRARDIRHGVPVLAAARFDHAVFVDAVDFRGVQFAGGVSFRRARFEAAADFRESVLEGHADFASVVFEHECNFSSARFYDAAFHQTTFGRAATFTNAQFGPVTFWGAMFMATAEMTDLALFAGADLTRVTFEDTVRLSCTLTGDFTADEARFRGLADLRIEGEDAYVIGLHRVLCEGQIDALLEATDISIYLSRFEKGGQFVLVRGTAQVRDSRLARPTLITGIRGDSRRSIPALGDLGGSDLSGTTLSGLTLMDTRFAGAHGIDGLRIDGRLILGQVSSGFRKHNRRLAIRDEEDAHANVREPWRTSTTFDQVAAIYRDLRASREGRKDEPGSADFYYGEMEMRRHAAPGFSAERAILQSYRVISGYGLRASRPVASLLALVVGATIAFHEGLVQDAPRWLTTLLFSLRSTVSLVREPRLSGMTLGGEFLQLGLRLCGPVLIALSVLAIRARVRR